MIVYWLLCLPSSWNLTSIPRHQGDWGIEIWSLGLLPTGSKTLAQVGGPFGCAGCIKFAFTSGQKGDVKSDA